jgi:hypothetical protein
MTNLIQDKITLEENIDGITSIKTFKVIAEKDFFDLLEVAHDLKIRTGDKVFIRETLLITPNITDYESDPIKKYCQAQGAILAKKIDDNLAVVIKHKPKYLPKWLYDKVLKEIVEIVKVSI